MREFGEIDIASIFDYMLDPPSAEALPGANATVRNVEDRPQQAQPVAVQPEILVDILAAINKLNSQNAEITTTLKALADDLVASRVEIKVIQDKLEAMTAKDEVRAVRDELDTVASRVEIKAKLDKLATKTELQTALDQQALVIDKLVADVVSVQGGVDYERIDHAVQLAVSAEMTGFKEAAETTNTVIVAHLDELTSNDGPIASRLGSVEDRLTAIGEGASAISDDIRDIHQRTINIDRIQRLASLFEVNGRRYHGPWVVIPNTNGLDPTAAPFAYRHLSSWGVLNDLTKREIYNYLRFYGVSPQTEGEIFNSPEEWTAEYRSARVNELWTHIENPSR